MRGNEVIVVDKARWLTPWIRNLLSTLKFSLCTLGENHHAVNSHFWVTYIFPAYRLLSFEKYLGTIFASDMGNDVVRSFNQ